MAGLLLIAPIRMRRNINRLRDSEQQLLAATAEDERYVKFIIIIIIIYVGSALHLKLKRVDKLTVESFCEFSPYFRALYFHHVRSTSLRISTYIEDAF
jgi:hypothetical protein